MTSTILVNTHKETKEIPVKWKGIALAVHRPPVKGGLSKTRCWWTITHIESGLAAGIYDGPLHEAIALAKAWDLTFSEELKGPNPDAKNWARKDKWKAQLNKWEPIVSPQTIEAILREYGNKEIISSREQTENSNFHAGTLV